MSGRMEFGFSFARPQMEPNRAAEDNLPLRILVLGNFSGDSDVPGTPPKPPLLQRSVIRIDIDRFDEVLHRLSPRLSLGADGTADRVEFHELDDFHPDRLGKKLATFRRLQELRQKLLSPATFAQAADELRQSLLTHPPESEQPAVSQNSPTAAPTEDDASLLERLLGQPSTAGSSAPKVTTSTHLPSNIQQMIDQAVAPYIVPKADPRQDVYLTAMDKALSDQMQAALHTPAFQALEATWRSLRNLIASIEDDGEIQIHLLDVTREELLAQVPADDEQLRQWSLYRRLTGDSNQAMGTVPWSLIIGDFRFSACTKDIALLSALAATAERLQAPLITSADSTLLGCPSLKDCPDPSDWKPLEADVSRAWQSLRKSSAAAWVGLILPRVLLRLPYGKATDEVDSFAFEEISATRRHEDYLWGNPAYLCAELIAQTFASEGWSMQLESQVDIGDLPAYTYSDDGEMTLQPCAEVAFGERTADNMLQRGLMPLLSWKDRNAVRFVRFQSISDPLAPLSGPWS